jgi:hypothetical protein
VEEYERLEEEAEASLVDKTTDYEYRPPSPRIWQAWHAPGDLLILISLNLEVERITTLSFGRFL